MTNFIESLFDIRPEEQRKAFLMFLYSACMIAAGFIIARTVSSTLFLKRIDPKYLPLTYVAIAVFVSLFSMGYTKVSDKLRIDKTIIGSFAIFLIVTLGLRAALEVAPNSLLLMATLFVFVEIMGTIAIIQFWTFANIVFTAREAKRLFAFFAAGGTTAGIVFGGIVRSIVENIGTPNLLFMIAGLQVFCIFLVFQLGNDFAEQLDIQHKKEIGGVKKPAPRNLLEDFRQLIKSSHLVTIAASLIVISIVIIIIDYQFMIVVRESFDNENKLAAFFGTFYIYTGVAAFVFQFLITNRVLTKYGILIALLFLPVVLLVASVGVLAASSSTWLLRATTCAKGGDNVIRYSINNPTFEILYMPVSAKFRSHAKALIDGIIKPVASGISGLLLLVLVKFISIKYLSIVVVMMISVWILLIIQARKQYMISLADTIKRKKLDLHGSMLPVNDTTIKVLESALIGNHERNAYNALELIDVVPGKNWDPIVKKLLYSKSIGLRIRAIEYLGRRDNLEYTGDISTFFNDREPEVRSAAYSSYCRIQGERGVIHIHRFMDDPDPQIKAIVVAIMINFGGIDGILMAADELKSMLESDDWKMRLAGAKVLGRIKVRQFYHPLEKLLQDENIQVQISAVKAAGEIKSPFLMPRLFEKLGNNKTLRAATMALSAYGNNVINHLRSALEPSDFKSDIRMYIPKILRLIGTQQCLDILIENINIENDRIRDNVIKEIANFIRDGNQFTIDMKKIKARCGAEIKNYYQQITIAAEFGGIIDNSLLAEVLDIRIKRIVQRVLGLLSVSYPDQPMESIARGIASTDASIRANAIELLDNILEDDDKQAILTMFEGGTIEKKLRLGQTCFHGLKKNSHIGWLRHLLYDDYSWTVACTIHQIGILGIKELSSHILKILENDVTLLRETAVVTLKRLMDTTSYNKLLEKISDKNDCLAELMGKQQKQTNSGVIMLSTIEKVLFLKSVDLFSQIPAEDLAQIEQIANETQFDRDQCIIKQGEIGDCLYLIIEGEVKVLMDTIEIARLGERECVGEMSILDSEPRSASVFAVTDVVLLKINQEDFYEIISERPEIAQGVITVLTRRLRAKTCNETSNSSFSDKISCL